MAQQIPFLPGATTIGLVCKDAVILASEKRVAYGYFVLSKAGKKVFKITDKVGAACAGMIADMQMLTKQVAAHSNLHALDSCREITVQAVGKLVANLLFERRLFPYLTQTIIGGVDKSGPQLYVLDPLGSILPDKFSCVGSGTEIATGVLEVGYKDNMPIDEAKKLVLQSMKAAVSRDIQSGGEADFLIITPEGAVEESLSLK
ncbi:MAG: proteasome subunit beta [Candidatus Bathyarchaeota archaeon]